MATDTAVAALATEKQLHSPPESNKESPSLKHDGSASDSELSDLEELEEDIGEITPAYYSDGCVPVFQPTMAQFKSFKLYMNKINSYGMRSGIVKVIPPAEWSAELPPLDEAIKTIRVKEPIKQDIMGTNGTYRQANILHQRSYNLPQWRQLCEQSEHQPPAKRGERRLNQDRSARPTPKSKGSSTPSTSGSRKKGPGRSLKTKSKAGTVDAEEGTATPDRLPTPVSPSIKPEEDAELVKQEADDEDESPTKPIGFSGRQPKAVSVSSRRKYNRREAAAKVDEAAFKDFKYQLEGEDYSPERCEELERVYWKTLTYAPPLYGADMPGSLFDDRTTTWNLGKLENLLDVMGTKIPGVNTAYLYLGMWKATFAWHLEDVDLYSINYLHFGAPKQWYSIAQSDARRFEAAMKSIWPADAKACDQFLRHKTFLISPSHLLHNYNIKVNKIVHRPGEFVITYPYGYHSGYNLGYNCAEAVNFALDSWLEYGRVAKKCDCSQAQDSVWIDVREIERKLRGEETDYEDTDDEDDEEDDENGPTDLPTPPESSGDTKIKAPRQKRKRPVNEKDKNPNLKRIRVRIKAPTKEPCILCPNDIPTEPLLPTEDGQKAHRLCALYIPETSIELGEKEIITDVRYIDKARLELKCNYCRSKKGACFQCSQKKCTRAYHATCAAAAGVLVEQGEVAVFGEDGTEYKDWGIEFSCRFHRSKRDKKLDGESLGDNELIRKKASELQVGDTCQMQYYKGDIFAGAVVENRKSEEMLLLNILPRGERVEVEYKWLLVPDPADYRLQKPSPTAIPMPKSFKAKESLNTSKRQADDLPRAEDPFVEGCTWAEFKCENILRNSTQIKIDFSKENQIWYYLGETSTEARAQFTEDLANRRHNPKGHFLDTIPKPISTAPRQSYAASYPSTVSQNPLNTAKATSRPSQPANSIRPEKPYVYKPRNNSDTYRVDPQAYRSQQSFLQRSAPAPYSFGTDPRWKSSEPPSAPSYSPKTTSYSPTTPHTPTTTYVPASSYNSATSYTPKSYAAAPYTPPSSYPSATSYNPMTYSSATSFPPASAPYPKYPASSSNPPVSRPTGVLAPPAHFQNPYPIPQPPPPRQLSYSGKSQMSRPSIFATYKYLQKEHNRSPLEYKSPYRPGGGFMNGYQGSYEKHVQKTLFQKQPNAGTQSSDSLMTYASNPRMYAPSQQSSSSSYSSMSPSPYGPYNLSSAQKQPPIPLQQAPKPVTQNTWESKDASQLHPAIRQEYSSKFQPQEFQASQCSAAPRQPQVSLLQAQHDEHPRQPAQFQQPYQAQHDGQLRQPTQNTSPQQSSQSQPPYQMHPLPQLGNATSDTAPPDSHPQYQNPVRAISQDSNPVYPHQQYFQKSQTQAQAQALPPQLQTQGIQHIQAYSQPEAQSQAQQYRDYPDVPADSTSIVERIRANLKKATSNGSFPDEHDRVRG